MVKEEARYPTDADGETRMSSSSAFQMVGETQRNARAPMLAVVGLSSRCWSSADDLRERTLSEILDRR